MMKDQRAGGLADQLGDVVDQAAVPYADAGDDLGHDMSVWAELAFRASGV